MADDPFPHTRNPRRGPASQVPKRIAEHAQAVIDLIRLSRGETPPAVPPRGMSDAEARALWESWRPRLEAHAYRPWEWAEAVAFEFDFYVPIHPHRVDGYSAPQFTRHLEARDRHVAVAYAREGLALANQPPSHRRWHRLSGIEAMRWLLGAPAPVEVAAMNFDEEAGGWVEEPVRRALGPLYPQLYAIADLRQAMPADLAVLGTMPGARGLKPEIVRTLVGAWPALVGPEDARIAITDAGGRWLPAFSDRARAGAFAAAHPEYVVRPEGGAPPFAMWLELAGNMDGVLLDPDAPAPLALDHTALAFLTLWVDGGGPQPRGRHLVRWVAAALERERIPRRLGARLVADWPHWYVHEPAVPGQPLHLFSTRGKAAAFAAFRRAAEPGVTPQPARRVLHHWQRSAFHSALAHNAGAILDADAAGGGLRLDREMLLAACARVEEHLRPRVPDFASVG